MLFKSAGDTEDMQIEISCKILYGSECGL